MKSNLGVSAYMLLSGWENIAKPLQTLYCIAIGVFAKLDFIGL
jgi:hypothetical protein